MTPETQLLRIALQELSLRFPTECDMKAAGWELPIINVACSAYEQAVAVLQSCKPTQPASAGVTAAQRDTLIDAELEARGYPSNSRNAARAGWYAHAKAMAAQPASSAPAKLDWSEGDTRA
jgi:hypothetical protein